jgi:hypothetical protein
MLFVVCSCIYATFPRTKIAQLNIPNGIPIIYDVSTRTLTLIQDGVQDPLEMYDFGVAAEYLFQRSGNVNGAKFEVNRL